LFTLENFLKTTQPSYKLPRSAFLRRRKLCIHFDKNGLGRILGDFFTNTSGHPASIAGHNEIFNEKSGHPTNWPIFSSPFYPSSHYIKKQNRKWAIRNRVARFFSVQLTKTGKNLPNSRKMYQMAIKYTQWPQNEQDGPKNTKHLPLQDLPKFTQIYIFCLKIWQH
jgi:hypothetical protein